MPKVYTESQKKQWVHEYQSGRSVKEICAENGISSNALYGWIKLFNATVTKKGTEISGHRLVTLEQQNKHLQEMFDISRICPCCPMSPRSEKLKAAENLVGKFSLHSICTYLDLPRGTYYNYIKSKNKIKVEDLKDEFFKPLIRQTFEKSGERMTAAQIRHRLRRDGHEIGFKRIKRLMKEMELIPYSQRQARFDYTSSVYGKRNKLRQRFNQTDPDKVWASDFTYICIGGTKYYLCVVLDLFSRKVLAYNLSDTCNAALVMTPAKEAFKLRGRPKGLMFHSDLGIQYTAYSFYKMLQDESIAQSFSRPGNPLDNAVSESFFATYKKEELYCKEFLSYDELAKGIADYIHYYNTERPHRRCGYIAPDEFEEDYYKEKARTSL